MKIQAWTVPSPRTTMALVEREEEPGAGEVIVEVAGCGVCHTDLGFFYDGVPPRHPFPLTLGHEVSGRVAEAGDGAAAWMGRQVVVPAVIPCGVCDACRDDHGPVCPHQVFPGCDVHGGFATHIRVPARGLCPVPDLTDPAVNRAGLDLAALSVIADAVSTPYQAVLRSGLRAGDLAVFVGAGGVGGFGIQIAAARGARVVAIDVNEARLDLLRAHGAALAVRADLLDDKEIRAKITALAREAHVPSWRTFVFETSGTPRGQVTAFSLLGHGSTLSIVGYTAQKVEVRLSNLMAFDAVARGNWGCLPQHYPAVVDLVLSGRVAIEPFIERRPLASINDVFSDVHGGLVGRRVVLIPEH